VTSVLCDPFRPDVSSLVMFGLDAADARVERYSQLLTNLRSPNHGDFRAEVEFLAALERGRIPHAPYEPRTRELAAAPGSGLGNPDFRALFDTWITLDVKHLRMTPRAVEAMERFFTVIAGPDRRTPIDLSVEFLPRFTEIERAVDAERFTQFCVELNRAARARADQMRERCIQEDVVEGVLRLRLLDPSYAYPGPTIEHPDDARRATKHMDEAATQIAPDYGLPVLVPDRTIAADHLLSVAERWLPTAPDHILGVVVVHDLEVSGFEIFLASPRSSGVVVHAAPQHAFSGVYAQAVRGAGCV
jgi:hypothetical protein